MVLVWCAVNEEYFYVLYEGSKKNYPKLLTLVFPNPNAVSANAEMGNHSFEPSREMAKKDALRAVTPSLTTFHDNSGTIASNVCNTLST